MAEGGVLSGPQRLWHNGACVFFYFANHKVTFQIRQSQTENILLDLDWIRISAHQSLEQPQVNVVGGISEFEV